jgi:UDP-N-acetylglucosamine--N-acetylmuramyl-(pentapeptide) pyrophosphoryl-undecaprenol N-acetylglucosamine transferase
MASSSIRLLICAGGTGGGVYPALSVLKNLSEPAPAEPQAYPGIQVLWVGGIGGMEMELVKREHVAFESIPAAGVHGVGLRLLPGNLWALARGLAASRRILQRFQPDVLFFTGGYLAVPMALASRLASGIRSLLYVPDIEPGLALKVLARFTDQIAVTAEQSRKYLPRKSQVVETGYPLRPDLSRTTPEQARQRLGLSTGLPVVLVTGGSRGARSINRAVQAILPDLLPLAQVLHITGQLDWQEVQANTSRMLDILPQELSDRYHPFPYLHEEMALALAAADVVISRAGASSLGEYPFFGLPAILVPYPFAWRYQQVNAQYLHERGAARIIQDSEMQEKLLPELVGLLSDQAQREAMGAAMRSLARPQAGREIASLLVALATGQSAV